MRASTFSHAVRFLEEVLHLQTVDRDEDMELARFKLPSGGILEVLGPKNIWHPFTTPPEWEVIIADIRHLMENSHNRGGQDQTGFTGP